MHITQAHIIHRNLKALALSLDASGDGNCGHVSLCNENKIQKISEISNNNSLGFFYTLMTHFLGFNDGDEYKVMGLAPYGKPNKFKRYTKNN